MTFQFLELKRKNSSGIIFLTALEIGLPPVAELIPEAKACQVNIVQKCPTMLVAINVVKSSAMTQSEKRPGLAHHKIQFSKYDIEKTRS